MSHLKGFQRPVIATPAALWILKGFLILVSLGFIIRACTGKKSIEGWFAQKTTPTSASPAPPPIPSATHRLRPNKGEWVNLKPGE